MQLLPDEMPYRWALFTLNPTQGWRISAEGRAWSKRMALRDVLAICQSRNVEPASAVARCEISGPQSGRWAVARRKNVTGQAQKDAPILGPWHAERI